VTASYDLHAHTTYSDGTLAPPELAARAHANGVRVLALTDHDTTDGVAEASIAAADVGLRVVPGVEISTTWQRETVHVLGLCIDLQYAPLQQGLARLRDFRVWRAQEIGRRLRKKNIDDAYDHANALARGRVISRTHFARFLVAHGYVANMGQAFRQYLARGRSAHVPGRWASVEEAVGWIRGAGGVAVLAHPARYRLTASKLRRLLREFKECGGAAIEVASGVRVPGEIERMAQLALDCALAGSAGSDFHGPENPWVELGRIAALPPAVEPVWTSFPRQYALAAGT
jgi:predicted metal-dependent phosphoesterase TrpH